MIPTFDGNTGYLPRGTHPASWAELEAALGFNARRRRLLVGLLAACKEFRNAGAKIMYVDGGFATNKWAPKDYDCCYVAEGIDSTRLDPVLLTFEPKSERAPMVLKYGGEFLPAGHALETSMFAGTIFMFFQRDSDHHYKGMVELDLSTLP